MTQDDTKIQPGQAKQAAKTTIVGGQPPGNQRLLTEVPVGLEQLLAMAAASEEFARALRADPDDAIAASGLRLTATERAVLGATPEPMVAKMIARVETLLPRPERRLFLEQAAAALVVLLGAGTLAACKGGGETGQGARSGGAADPMDTQPLDIPRPMEAMRDHPPPGPPMGIRPDPPPPRPPDAMKRPMDSGMKRPMVPKKRPRPRDAPKSRGISHHRRNVDTGIRPDRRGDKR